MGELGQVRSGSSEGRGPVDSRAGGRHGVGDPGTAGGVDEGRLARRCNSRPPSIHRRSP